MDKRYWKTRHLYPTQTLGQCEMCGKRPARDRHHKDGDTYNNDRSNIQFLCLPCHQSVPKRPAPYQTYRGPRVYRGPKRIPKAEVSARIDMEVAASMDKIAAHMGISRNKVLALAAEYYVKDWEKQWETPTGQHREPTSIES